MIDREQVYRYWTSKPAHVIFMLLNKNGEHLDPLEREEIFGYLPSFKGKTVLDLGAGIGRFTRQFAKQAKKVFSVDLCEHFIEENQRLSGTFHNIKWMTKDVMELQFPRNSIDLVFMNSLMMYLEDEDAKKLLQEVRSWLKLGGHLFFRESCAPRTHVGQTEGYPAIYRSPIDYDRFVHEFNTLKTGNIRIYEDLLADPFKCFWLLEKTQ